MSLASIAALVLLSASPAVWTPKADAPVYSIALAAGSVWLRDPTGQPLADLVPRLRVEYVGHDPIDQTFAAPRLQRGERDGWEITAEHHTAAALYRYALRHSPGDSRLRGRLTVTYSDPVRVRTQHVRFQVSDVGRAHMLDRDYRVRAVASPRFTGPLTPHMAFFGTGARAITVLGRDGVQGMWTRPDRADAFAFELELDHEDNHPMVLYGECVDSLREKETRVPMKWTPRIAGDTDEMHFDIILGDFTPLRLSRLPFRYSGVIALTDHADQSSAAKLEAFAFGRTGALAAGELGPGHPGFVNRGLNYTKTIFLKRVREYAPQWEEPAFRRVLAALYSRGVEVGLHSVTGWRDTPADVRRLLADFRAGFFKGEPVGARTWIDHQPQTNCEAIANQGWNPGGDWYVLDRLRGHGVRTLWSVYDARLPRGSLNLLAPEWFDRRRPVVFEHAAFPGFRLFHSSWMFFRKREAFLDLFSEERLARLESEWGIAIGHVYLDTHRTRGRLKGRNLIDAVGAGRYRLRDDADALFRRLAERQSAGTLLVGTIDEIAGHALRALNIFPEYLPDGRARIVSQDGITGLTLMVPQRSGATLHAVGGEPWTRNGQSALTLDVGQGGAVTVTLMRDGVVVPFLRSVFVPVAP